jgi:hypothetical protein
VAVTEKLAIVPAGTDCAVGCCVMLGAAALLPLSPSELVAT